MAEDLQARVAAHGGLWIGGSKQEFLAGCQLLYAIGVALRTGRP